MPQIQYVGLLQYIPEDNIGVTFGNATQKFFDHVVPLSSYDSQSYFDETFP